MGRMDPDTPKADERINTGRKILRIANNRIKGSPHGVALKHSKNNKLQFQRNKILLLHIIEGNHLDRISMVWG